MSSGIKGGFKPTRERIMDYLLIHSSPEEERNCTVKKIAETLSLSENGVRQHIGILEKDNLIFRKVLHKTLGEGSVNKSLRSGRPATVYSINEEGVEFFPKTYVHLTLTMLAELEEQLGKEFVISFLKRIGIRLADEIRRIYNIKTEKTGKVEHIKKNVKILEKVFRDYDKYPKLEEDADSYMLRNYNCLYYGLSRSNRLVCNVNEKLIEELIGVPSVKDHCIMDGNGFCQYRIPKFGTKTTNPDDQNK